MKNKKKIVIILIALAAIFAIIGFFIPDIGQSSFKILPRIFVLLIPFVCIDIIFFICRKDVRKKDVKNIKKYIFFDTAFNVLTIFLCLCIVGLIGSTINDHFNLGFQ